VAIALVEAMARVEHVTDVLELVAEVLADEPGADPEAAMCALDRLRSARKEAEVALRATQELAEASIRPTTRPSRPDGAEIRRLPLKASSR